MKVEELRIGDWVDTGIQPAKVITLTAKGIVQVETPNGVRMCFTAECLEKLTEEEIKKIQL